MFEQYLSEIKQHAIDSYPNECCGFITEDGYVRVGNIHSNPRESFKISNKDYMLYGSKALAFIHSHPDWHPCPSEKDMRGQIDSGIPWGIVSTNGKKASNITWFGDQIPTPELKGRGFIHGVTDCYSIIRDWYKIKRDVVLPEFPRSWEWWEGDADLYMDGFEKAGFKRVDSNIIAAEGPKEGDVFLAQVGNGVRKINHGGVYTGNGLGLHHLTSTEAVDFSRISKEEPIIRWMKFIVLWVRYNDSSDSSTR